MYRPDYLPRLTPMPDSSALYENHWGSSSTKSHSAAMAQPISHTQ